MSKPSRRRVQFAFDQSNKTIDELRAMGAFVPSKEVMDAMSSVEAFHARTLASQEEEKELTGKGQDCGASTSGSLAFFDHATSSWKTHQLCLDGEWEEFSETWPVSGMTRNGIAFHVPPSVPFISGTGSFFWPTPTANAHRDGGIDRWGGSNARKALKKRIEAVEEDPCLRMFTTPTADDTGHRKKPYSQGGEALSYQIGGPVNPTWEEWLMGFPMHWTDVGDSATPSSHK